MRRSTSRIGKLPGEVLEEVNEKLYASWEYREIRKWLFEEVAEVDVPALGLVKGEKFGLVWLRAGKSTEHAFHHCELALGNWFRSWHGVWVRQKLLRSEPLRVVKRAAALTKAAAEESSGDPPSRGRYGGRVGGLSDGEDSKAESAQLGIEGGDIIMRSVLIDAISQVTDTSAGAPGAMADSRPPASAREIAQLANAWARLNAGKMEEEKLKLKTEDALMMGLRAVKDELQAIPEAMELFHKMSDVINRHREKVDPLAK